MMKCERVTKLLPFFQDGSLEPGIARDVGDHLDQCARCREEFRFLDTLMHKTRESFQKREFPFRAGYTAAVQAKIRRKKRERTFISWAVPAAAAVFLMVSVTTSSFLFHNTGTFHSARQTAPSAVRAQAVDENTLINVMYHYTDVSLDDVIACMNESELATVLESEER